MQFILSSFGVLAKPDEVYKRHNLFSVNAMHFFVTSVVKLTFATMESIAHVAESVLLADVTQFPEHPSLGIEQLKGLLI